jgi:hypothetical protein
MRNLKTLRNTLVAGAFIALAACSSSTGGGTGSPAGGGGGIAVQVTNDVVPPTSITVWMVPETGSRRRLGTISPNGQDTFNYNPAIRSMEHRIVAQASGAQDRTSNPFVLEGVTSVQWSVSSVVVRTNR